MINAEFLANCSDEQIEKGLAWLEVNSTFSFDQMCQFQYFVCNEWLTDIKHYCLDPSDIMPIAIANDIEFVRRKGVGDKREFIASKNLINSANKNPYRAICEVYILMSVNK